MRLIDVEEAYKVLTDYYHHKTEIQHKALKEAIERVPIADIDAITESHERIGYDRGFRDGYAEALEATDNAEPVKHGHWIEVQRIHEKDHTAICECSLCGDTVWVYDGQRAWNYCPNCGAHMEEKDGAERK